MDTNYFVCTLGQAALRNDDQPYDTVNTFFQYQARSSADVPAVGFFKPKSKGSQDLDTQVLSFGQIARGTRNVASRLVAKLSKPIKKGDTVALLCPSTADFLFTWLALMYSGAAVLLIAPQLQPSAIVHLCKSCNVDLLVCDTMYEDLARRSVDEMKSADQILDLLDISSYMGDDVFALIDSEDADTLEPAKLDTETIAYTFHTSGTSSGLPKPIPQPHASAVAILPRILDQEQKATFTTTPLYHGGISDCFRAWTSNALVWLFPGKGFPITASNIMRCLSVAPTTAANGVDLPPLKYFTSVPYILQMMGEDEKGLQRLRDMDLVGVGGAALSSEVGDRLVQEGVNIVSRYGSAECGFLLSSHRDYANDKDWQYLRTDSGLEYLRLEPKDDDLSEMVVIKGWPHMAKTNREDGSFATSDLLIKHPSTPNAWKYHSRSDAQLTLVTGKKFDPTPLEDSLVSNPQIQDALIFGNDQPYPGVLIFPSRNQEKTLAKDLRSAIVPLVEKLNAESQSHARIPKAMVIIMPYEATPLEKSSKGTVMRNKAEVKFADAIEKAYSQSEGADAGQDVSDDRLVNFVTDSLQKMSDKDTPLDAKTDLYAYGLDSITAIQLRRRLQSLLPKDAKPLPMSIVEDCGSPEKIAEYIINIRRGKANADREDDTELMRELVEKYSAFEVSKDQKTGGAAPSVSTDQGQVIVLTGATGALGAHILDRLSKSTDTSTIYCLVRGADDAAAQGRVEKSLEQKGLSKLDASKVKILPAKLGSHRLGLDDKLYAELASKATVIIHVAWEVNFRMKLRNFEKDNIAGLHNILQLAFDTKSQSPDHKPPRILYCSSTASVITLPSSTSNPILEAPSSDPTTASPLGYAKSKWVAEAICQQANKELKANMAVLRVGQLSGDTKNGIWNPKEAWPMMLSTVKLTGTIPNLSSESLDWLPVDLAAQSFFDIMRDMLATKERAEDPQRANVYHVLNAHKEPKWSTMLQWLQKLVPECEVVEPGKWIEELERLQSRDEEVQGHPAMKLLGLWKEAYGGRDESDAGEKKGADAGTDSGPVFDVKNTQGVSETIKSVKPLDEEYFGKVWGWIDGAF